MSAAEKEHTKYKNRNELFKHRWEGHNMSIAAQ